MGIVKVSIPNVTWRDGRPRFTPGPRARKLGYKGEDLKHPDGRWFTLDEAGAWAHAKALEMAERRDRRKAGKNLAPIRRPAHATIQGLFDEWLTSPKFNEGEARGKRSVKPVSEATKLDYRYKINALAAFDPQLMQEAPGAVTHVVAQGVFDGLWEQKGLYTARGVAAMVSSCWSWALRRGRGAVTVNPWIGLQKPMPLPRLVTWSDQAVVAFTAAADLLGRPEFGDALYLGLFTGQRQSDRLTLEAAGKDDAGRLQIRQSKTGAIVAIPPAPQLVARLEAAARRRKAKVAAAILANKSEAERKAWPHLVIDETANTPFAASWYRHQFARIRLAAERGLVAGWNGEAVIAPENPAPDTVWLQPPCPAVAGLRDQDLRDTAVTWLGRAGCTVPQIASISGHSYASIHQVLKHYLALHPEMADDAIGKLMAWMKRTGMAV